MDTEDTKLKLLHELLGKEQRDEAESFKPENLRYVIYTRKSTLQEDRQEKSISQQLADCIEKVVKPHGLNITEESIVKEQGSAREPDIRPKFRKMLDDIKAGKYDGIISGHPDRLARNMKEAGEIIDLLDKKVIKDLRFVTSTFENNPTGKMLLGISFVLSKQYSEHLSEQVARGNKRYTESGAFIGKFKHGYYITDTTERKLIPDDGNFLIVQEAFNMRINGSSQSEVLDYLNSKPEYKIRKWKQDPAPYRWTKNNVSLLLSDPVYAGILKYGKHTVNLIEAYGFTPMLSAENFLKINQASSFASGKFVSAVYQKSIHAKADLLRGLVFCNECKRTMTSSITTKNKGKENRYFYKCETPTCSWQGKSTRAKVVVDFAVSTIDAMSLKSKEAYALYSKQIKANISRQKREITSKIAFDSKLLLDKEKEFENAKRMASSPSNSFAKFYLEDLEPLSHAINELKQSLNDLAAKKDALGSSILSFEKFLELFENSAKLLRSATTQEQLDKNLRNFYSNFYLQAEFVPPNNKITRWKVVDFKLKEPFDRLFDIDPVLNGRGGVTSNEPILNTLHMLLLNHSNIKERLIRLHRLVEEFAYSERASNMQFLL